MAPAAEAAGSFPLIDHSPLCKPVKHMMRLFLPTKKNFTNSAWKEISETRKNHWDFKLFRTKASFLLFGRLKIDF